MFEAAEEAMAIYKKQNSLMGQPTTSDQSLNHL